MTTLSLPLRSIRVDSQTESAVAEGLLSHPKSLPSWLFYDEAGSRLFDKITELPEYYLTRTERAIFAANADEIIARSAGPDALRIVELGAGSCDKTRLLLRAAVERQDTVVYEPVDVSVTALEQASERIEQEIPGVLVCPRVEDYCHNFDLEPPYYGERRLVLYIGSSIGNFDSDSATRVLRSVRAALLPGDSILLGVDLTKPESILLPAYDDAAGVTAAFNRNILARINRELDADFDPAAFAHRATWNASESRMEMHLVSRKPQLVELATLGLTIRFAAGEAIHTENSYKYRAGQAETLLRAAGFAPEHAWTDEHNWFAVHLARVA